MNREMQIILEVNNQADSFYDDAVKLGDHAAAALKRSRAQLTGLETIAESTNKISDVFDYIKKQTARNSSWRQTYKDSPDEGFGVRLKNYLDTKLRIRANTLCEKRLNIGDTSEEDQRERRRIHLLLMRQFIHKMVVQYEYMVNVSDIENKLINQTKEAQKNKRG
ncbi:MAG TPA: hypothetical protein VFA41_04120 [Ktedonobacteraceae bacterium]|jgi:cysteinyl-tRNA synthetase|nr:hypothetical protein [Ktedonobacteraceae bacterium]